MNSEKASVFNLNQQNKIKSQIRNDFTQYKQDEYALSQQLRVLKVENSYLSNVNQRLANELQNDQKLQEIISLKEQDIKNPQQNFLQDIRSLNTVFAAYDEKIEKQKKFIGLIIYDLQTLNTNSKQLVLDNEQLRKDLEKKCQIIYKSSLKFEYQKREIEDLKRINKLIRDEYDKLIELNQSTTSQQLKFEKMNHHLQDRLSIIQNDAQTFLQQYHKEQQLRVDLNNNYDLLQYEFNQSKIQKDELEQKIQDLFQKQSNYEQEIQNYKQNIQDLKKKIALEGVKLKQEQINFDNEIQVLKLQLKNNSNYDSKLEFDNQQLKKANLEICTQNEFQKNENEQQQQLIENYKNKLLNLQKKDDINQIKIKDYKEKTEYQQIEFEKDMIIKDQEIQTKNKQIDEFFKEIQDLRKQINDQQKENKNKNQQNQGDNQVKILDQELKIQKLEMNLKQAQTEKNSIIHELEAIKNQQSNKKELNHQYNKQIIELEKKILENQKEYQKKEIELDHQIQLKQNKIDDLKFQLQDKLTNLNQLNQDNQQLSNNLEEHQSILELKKQQDQVQFEEIQKLKYSFESKYDESVKEYKQKFQELNQELQIYKKKEQIHQQEVNQVKHNFEMTQERLSNAYESKIRILQQKIDQLQND